MAFLRRQPSGMESRGEGENTGEVWTWRAAVPKSRWDCNPGPWRKWPLLRGSGSCTWAHVAPAQRLRAAPRHGALPPGTGGLRRPPGLQGAGEAGPARGGSREWLPTPSPALRTCRGVPPLLVLLQPCSPRPAPLAGPACPGCPAPAEAREGPGKGWAPAERRVPFSCPSRKAKLTTVATPGSWASA